MKNVLALSLSLLMPVAPVLAQTPPAQATPPAETGQASQPAATNQATPSAATLANANNTAQALGADQRDAPTVGTGQTSPADPAAAPQGSPSPQTTATHDHSALANLSTPPEPPAKKPSFFSKLKASVIGFATKHPVLAGAILGGMLCLAGGPAIFVIGVSLGAVAGDVTSYLIKSHKKSDS